MIYNYFQYCIQVPCWFNTNRAYCKFKNKPLALPELSGCDVVQCYICHTFELTILIIFWNVLFVIGLTTEAEKDDTHIMISYSWSYKPIALEIRDRLKTAGFKIWIDVDHMCTYCI